MRNNLDHHAPPKFPAWGWGVLALLVIISWLPLALIVRSRTVRSEHQPIHMFLDMDFQPRYGPQDYQPESLAEDFPDQPARFADGRAMRPPVPGAVRYDGRDADVDPDDDHFYRGYQTNGNLDPVMVDVEVSGAKMQEPKYYDAFPAALKVDRALIERGRERFNIYCSVCHGRAGYGDGPVHQRITMRQNLDATAISGWVQPRNFHLPQIVQMPAGKIFDRITRGVYAVGPDGKKTYTMWPYAAQVPARDRWAIVAYIRVLQMAQEYPVQGLPEDLRSQVEKAPIIDRKIPKAAADTGPATGETIIVPPAFPISGKELSDPVLIAKGKELFLGVKLCWTCHQTEPEKIAPTGVALNAPKYMGKFWGEVVEAHDGPGGPLKKVKFDEGYFIESLREPMKRIVKGAIPGMVIQPYTEDEIKALAAYVRSLSK